MDKNSLGNGGDSQGRKLRNKETSTNSSTYIL